MAVPIVPLAKPASRRASLDWAMMPFGKKIQRNFLSDIDKLFR
jgi:hypothetical protein